MAAKQVLLLPELLEIILLHLESTRDLLFAQKICLTWKAVMNTSPAIQKALYLIAGTPADVGRHEMEHWCAGPTIGSSVVDYTFNSLLLVDGSFRRSVMRNATHSSCARMLITQPPREISIWLDFEERRYDELGPEPWFSDGQSFKVTVQPELLENILLNLPIRDLLFSQAVCRRWKATVNSSVRIQRALFFIPGTAEDINYVSPDHTASTKWMVPDTQPGQFCPRSVIYCANVKQLTYALNPLLTTYEVEGEQRYTLRPEFWRSKDTDLAGSWSRMYLTQPPVAVSSRAWLEASLIPLPHKFCMWKVWGPPQMMHTVKMEAVVPAEKFGTLVGSYHCEVERFREERREKKEAVSPTGPPNEGRDIAMVLLLSNRRPELHNAVTYTQVATGGARREGGSDDERVSLWLGSRLNDPFFLDDD
ncbi:hypothetical protein LTR27_003762 [Elasticomyces elasticus]|nr:hypothetical protein LTR27_003762 [Elasticomyces elasticus]